MLEIISAFLPFLLLGFIAAGLSRLSGVALSMIIVPTILIWGAAPVDVIAFMLLFVVYNNFTTETQDIRLDYKDLVLFPKWRICIPFILTLVITFFLLPAAGLAFFMACFVLEMVATVYKRIPENQRPRVYRVVVLAILSAVVTAVGAYAGPQIPGGYYFICAGAAILVITAFAWYTGNHRDAFKSTWEIIWVDFNVLLGMFGVEASNYPEGIKRSFTSPMTRMLPMLTVVGGYAGLMVVFAVYGMFSIPSLITAIGSAIGIRFFGLYEFPRTGGFSYLAIGFAVMAVICLYLVYPEPVGFDYINALVSKPLGQ